MATSSDGEQNSLRPRLQPRKSRAARNRTAHGAETSPAGADRGRSPLFKIAAAATVAALIIICGGLTYELFRSAASPLSGASPPSTVAFVGAKTCAGCHEAEAALWRDSQHAHAMDHATDVSVLGNFADTAFEKNGTVSRFFRSGKKFMVETDGPDGNLATFEVKYTFGLDPLQQYLIEFPDGRLQSLTIAWDARSKELGGQRWFDLYENQNIPADDDLHWTKLNQNWNFMCAECHSTGVRKNYDATADRFATNWSEINVACEACHGQGSGHVAWAQSQKSWLGRTTTRDNLSKGLLVSFDERAMVSWAIDPVTSNPRRSEVPATLRKEVETCGLCHARRAGFSEDWVPGRWLSETHVVTPIRPGLFYADGQMQDEVYNYASFKQSKMFAAGVTCSDCHDPHSAKLVLPKNGVCLQCHTAQRYDTADHHHHEGVTPPVSCSNCHMPERTYMVVDRRHDHSFRIPRPDETVSVGVPNACNGCHADRTASWAAAAVEGWYGADRKGFQGYAAAFDAAWNGKREAALDLEKIVVDTSAPAIARASALSELAGRLSPRNLDLARNGLTSDDPMVRIAALDMLENLPIPSRWTLASPLLTDPVSGVRIRVVALAADVHPADLPPNQREQLEHAEGEFIASHRFNADRPESRSALGSFYLQRGLMSEAKDEFQAALRLSPRYAVASVNLADLHRRVGRNDLAEDVLRAAIAQTPADAGLHHALGLTLVRIKQTNEAVAELGRAVELDPASPRYAYVYAVALHSSGNPLRATERLRSYADRFPESRDILLALITFSRDAGDLQTSLRYGLRLLELAPEDEHVRALVDQLRRSTPGR